MSQSTPIQSRKAYNNDMMKYLCSMMCIMKERPEKQFDVIESNFNKISSRFDANDTKMN